MSKKEMNPPVREVVFYTGAEKYILDRYRKLFSIHEIEETPALQWVFGGLLLALLVTFFMWSGSAAITEHAYTQNLNLCWPYFQNCGQWYFLESLPYGYSQSIFYMGIFSLMLVVVYLMSKKEWVLAHMGVTLLWSWKVIVSLVLTQSAAGNFDYYDIILGFALLFLPNKLFFLRLFFVFGYFLASTIKIHHGWILGTYFTTLKLGLPIFGNEIAPLVTMLVISVQMVGSWFLFSANKTIQRSVLVFFIFFHLYSGIIVLYRYPITALVMLLLLFGPNYKQVSVPLDKRSIAGWLFAALLVFLQFQAILIPGDQKMTLEGNKYGFYMFEANHQCRSYIEVYYRDGKTYTGTLELDNARNRCDPYARWFRLKQYCLRSESPIERIRWSFDHSIDGGPFYRIVDVQDACKLEYLPFSHNDWIKTPESGAPVIGRPVKNYYR